MTTFEVPNAALAGFDSAPLSWVMPEIREALLRSRTALFEAGGREPEERATALQLARTHLHQAHGALLMVDIDGVGLLTGAAELALERFKDGSLEYHVGHAEVLAEVYQALIEYLEELLAGAPFQPVRLFPYYRALQEMLGTERNHPADLFYPDLQAPVAIALAAPVAAADYPAARQRFEKALLPFLKSADAASQMLHAATLRDAIGLVADAQQTAAGRTFWFAQQTFADLVAGGRLPCGLYVKQLFGLINLQMRRLAQGSEALPDVMLRDALFFIASVEKPTAAATQLRHAYRLGGLVPPEFEVRRYGQLDLAALAQAKEDVRQAKDQWGRLSEAGADAGLAASFGGTLLRFEQGVEKLKLSALVALARRLGDVARAVATAGRNDALSVEMATALLFAEFSLEQIRHLPDDFAGNAETIAARLDALATGATPPPPSQWQGDMSRQMEQDQTITVLAAEMKNALRQVEKVLDDYYTDAAKLAGLAAADAPLYQLQGALSVLDQDGARQAAGHVRLAVKQLLDSAGGDAHALDAIAQNVGALGFFVDMLAHNAEAARGRFRFDAQAGTFRAIPFEKIAAAEAVPLLDEELAPPAPVVMAPPPPPPLASGEAEVEAELLEIFIGEAEEVLGFVMDTLAGGRELAASVENLTMLRRSFHTLKGSGRMVGLNRFADAGAAIERVMNVWLAESRPASTALFDLLDWAAADLRAWVAELATTGHSARDPEPLVSAAARVQEGEPFEMRAAEAAPANAVAELIDAAVAPAATEPEATVVAEAPEHIPELVLQPLADELGEESTNELTDEFADELADELADAAPEELVAVALPELDVEAPAETITATLPEEAELAQEPEPVEQVELAMPPETALEAEPETLPDAAAPTPEAMAPEPELVAAPLPETATGNVIEFPSAVPAAGHDEDNVKRVGDLEIGLPLYNIYLVETDELIRSLGVDLGEWRHEPERPVSEEALHDAHTLAGTSGTVGFTALRNLAHALEVTFQHVMAPAPVLTSEQHDVFDQVLERIRQMLQGFALGELAPEQPDQIAALRDLRDQLAAAPKRSTDPLDELEGQLNELFAETYTSLANSEPAAEAVAVEAAPAEPTAGNADDLFDSMFDDAFSAPSLTQAEPEAEAVVEAEAEAVVEAEAEAVAEPEPEPEPDLAIEAEAAAAVEVVAEAAPLSMPAEPEPADLAGAEPEEMVSLGTVFSDELDIDLLPVFIEEGSDLLPQVGEGLRKWQANPQDASQAQMLLRVLHTVKGSARMAGAMRLGQHAHEIETHIENMVHAGSATPQAFEELLAHYDHALLLFERLQHPSDDAGLAPAAPLAAADVAVQAAITAATTATNSATTPAAATPQAVRSTPVARKAPLEAMAADAKVALVRVRADILDRLVNQAGEVSISRSKLDNEVAGLRTSLFEFTDNLARLRRQLREIEVQAESQIASRMSISSDREFDPLEFDRFTRLQELTRMMAESVNDVASFHENLTRNVDKASDDLTQQARLTRELQRDLMRVRMVPFSSVAERLFRVARQSAKEIDKRVNLDIRGGAVEVDRSVLERMVAPFEHLLRNAIAHGIETRERREAAGKNEVGELLVQVGQQGNEVFIEFIDDGAGLDLDRIRAKARASGLLGADEACDDAAAGALIFAPGFSTADSLTELSGRGVGMDIVRSEAEALGGRVETATVAGQGARFTIHLPLTLAVTQVVLLNSGGKLFALPSTLVEQVLQLKEAELAQAHSAAALQTQGEAVPLHYLPTLLGDLHARPLIQRHNPVLVLKNGSERLAVQVDEVIGNREVVIKNIGPQLSRMPGIAGATVLGNGDIVLILNPLLLALPEQPVKLAAPTPAGVAAVAAEATSAQRVIMVVDDSLTVRRVSQRMLEREGYQVLLAKDGVDALEQLQEVTPDLMLVDIEMPRMDGFDLTRNVRGGSRTQDIPIIMITSRSADKHRNHAMELGVNAYFGKPFQEPLLLAAILGLLPERVA